MCVSLCFSASQRSRVGLTVLSFKPRAIVSCWGDLSLSVAQPSADVMAANLHCQVGGYVERGQQRGRQSCLWIILLAVSQALALQALLVALC